MSSGSARSVFSFLDKQHSIAGPGYSRWLVPPAALAIHLSIGEVYAFSVFKIPLSQVLGVTHQVSGDWSFVELGWIFSIAIAFLGISAAVFGRWLEDAGPRKAMFASACCFGGGFLVSALGVRLHQLWLIYLRGYGVLGGIGLGLGYISPVSTLIKWFADRPGMATGMAIMGFGGGAMIGARPLSNLLMRLFQMASSNPMSAALRASVGLSHSPLAPATTTGVGQAFVAMGILYFLFMMFGVFTVRIPPPNWRPAGAPVSSNRQRIMITSRNIDVNIAWKTPQFWLLWVVLCANVTAGIGILEHASPWIQEMFKGRVNAIAAGGFVGLLSLFNMIGRFAWSSVSDYIGRKATYAIFFALGGVLYVAVTFTGHQHLNSVALFVALSCIIISMYGGGFATIPAYLRDLFGTMHVGAIHGRLLTAWSVAGILGPVLVNNMREYQVTHGVAPANAYSIILYTMAALLVVGFICNLLVRPVPETVASMSMEPASQGTAVSRQPTALPGSAAHEFRPAETAAPAIHPGMTAGRGTGNQPADSPATAPRPSRDLSHRDKTDR